MEGNDKSFLFSFFFPSLFMIFHSSSISQCVVFKKQGLINVVSDTEDETGIWHLLFAAFKLAMVFSIFLISYLLYLLSC